jgi:hypothetical protein
LFIYLSVRFFVFVWDYTFVVAARDVQQYDSRPLFYTHSRLVVDKFLFGTFDIPFVTVENEKADNDLTGSLPSGLGLLTNLYLLELCTFMILFWGKGGFHIICKLVG